MANCILYLIVVIQRGPRRLQDVWVQALDIIPHGITQKDFLYKSISNLGNFHNSKNINIISQFNIILDNVYFMYENIFSKLHIQKFNCSSPIEMTWKASENTWRRNASKGKGICLVMRRKCLSQNVKHITTPHEHSLFQCKAFTKGPMFSKFQDTNSDSNV